jgi:hypothetical protein
MDSTNHKNRHTSAKKLLNSIEYFIIKIALLLFAVITVIKLLKVEVKSLFP